MTIRDLEFLASQEGGSLLEQLSLLTWPERHKFLFKTEAEKRAQVSVASAIIEAREKAEGKFSLAHKMFFTSLGLEQSSSEKISDYIAERFRVDWRVADLGCGIGGNLLPLAKKTKKVIALDEDEITLTCAKLNAKVYGLENKIEFLNLKAEEFIASDKMKNIEAVFLDPARDREGKTKTRSILNSRPNLLEILPEIFKQTKNVAVKISPAFDWQEISLLPEEPEVEVISENNTCKVAILWFGELKRGENKASCFRKDGDYIFTNYQEKNTIFLDSDIGAVMADKVLAYVCEPDKAISRSGLLGAYASQYDLRRLAITNSYLTGIKADMEAARIFRVKQIFQISLKNLKQELKKLNIDRAEILAKNYLIKPEEIYKHLKIKEGGEYTLIFVVIDKKKVTILAERLK